MFYLFIEIIEPRLGVVWSWDFTFLWRQCFTALWPKFGVISFTSIGGGGGVCLISLVQNIWTSFHNWFENHRPVIADAILFESLFINGFAMYSVVQGNHSRPLVPSTRGSNSPRNFFLLSPSFLQTRVLKVCNYLPIFTKQQARVINKSDAKYQNALTNWNTDWNTLEQTGTQPNGA